MSEMGRGYCHRGGKVKGFEFVPMNRDFSRHAVFLNARGARLILWRTKKFAFPLSERPPNERSGGVVIARSESDEAIQNSGEGWIASLSLAMTSLAPPLIASADDAPLIRPTRCAPQGAAGKPCGNPCEKCGYDISIGNRASAERLGLAAYSALV